MRKAGSVIYNNYTIQKGKKQLNQNGLGLASFAKKLNSKIWKSVLYYHPVYRVLKKKHFIFHQKSANL